MLSKQGTWASADFGICRVSWNQFLPHPPYWGITEQNFCPLFKNRAACFLPIIELQDFFIYSGYDSLVWYMCCKYFFPSLVCLCLLTDVFRRSNNSTLTKPNSSLSSFSTLHLCGLVQLICFVNCMYTHTSLQLSMQFISQQEVTTANLFNFAAYLFSNIAYNVSGST